MSSLRSYKPSDYPQVIALYKQSDLFGGQFDENRDSEEKLNQIIAKDPESILVYVSEGKITGTVSLIEDGRVAWLFRFAVTKDDHEQEITKTLSDRALEILHGRGHAQVLVYAPVNKRGFEDRYAGLGFKKGSDYTCYWKDT